MAIKSKIEWTDATWNPATGCTKISSGCDNCYAERFAERWRGVVGHPYEHGFDLRIWPQRLELPKQWRKPKMIFVNSMSDLFHKDLSWDFIDQVFETMEYADWHVYQVLTKRSTLMRRYMQNRYPKGSTPPHIWFGVSVENRTYKARIRHLLDTPAAVKFLSLEPLIGPIGRLDLSAIDWVIVGGESGPNARPMKFEWVKEIRDACKVEDVPFFFKQWGGYRPKSGGRLLEGRIHDAMPHYLKEVV